MRCALNCASPTDRSSGWPIWRIWLFILRVFILASLPPEEVAGVAQSPSVRAGLAFVALLSSAYSMVFLEPKDPVHLRWLGEQARAGHFYKAFRALEAWMLSYGVVLVEGLVLTVLLAMDQAVVGPIRLWRSFP